MHKVAAYIDGDMVLHLLPRDTADEILFKYLGKELQAHGVALINIESTSEKYKQLKRKTEAEAEQDPS